MYCFDVRVSMYPQFRCFGFNVSSGPTNFKIYLGVTKVKKWVGKTPLPGIKENEYRWSVYIKPLINRNLYDVAILSYNIIIKANEELLIKVIIKSHKL